MPTNGLDDFDLLTLPQVAALLHCSKAHICKAIAGRVPGCSPIPAIRLGRRKLVRRQSLLSWISSNERAANDNEPRPANDNIAASPERDAGKRAKER